MTPSDNALHCDQIHQRLSRMCDDIAESDANSAAALEAVFEKRAKRLASNRSELAEPHSGESVLSFRLGNECYGLALRELAEVLPLEKWVRVPGMPDSLLGVMNLRGEIRPVLNLHMLLSVAEANPSPNPQVLFLRGLGQEIGLRVDAIQDVATVDVATLSMPSEGAALLGRYVKGMTKNDVILLDTEQLFALDIFRDVVADYSRTP